MDAPIYNISQAKTQLSRLIAEAANGAEIVIARNGDPIARLVPINRAGVRRFGALAGQISLDETFFEPLPEDELAAWGQ